MSLDKYKENILTYIAKMQKDGLIIGNNDTISIRTANGMIVTPLGVELTQVTSNDIVEITKFDDVYALHKAIYDARDDINAIIHCHSKNCSIVAKAGVDIPAALDDMAQIIGLNAKCAKANDSQTIVKTLKGRNAVLIKDNGVIGTGRTLDECFTGCLVLEKGAKIFVESVALGGSNLIKFFEGKLMRFIYKKKYSKADQSSKMAEMDK